MKTIVEIVSALAFYAVFVVSIAMAAIDFSLIMVMWDKVPTDIHIRVFGWNSLLITNALCTTLVAGLILLIGLSGGRIRLTFTEKKS